MIKLLYAVSALYVKDMVALEERRSDYLSTHEAEANSWAEDGKFDGEERPYQVVNGAAIYSIRGAIVQSEDFWTKVFNIASYEGIGNSFAQMAQDDEVDRVLISMGTPGGAVAGISDISDMWAQLNAVKPITVHTPSTLASAGIWLASNSTAIYASETAEIGSIGVRMRHVSQEEALKKAGIKVTDIASTPLKALGSSAKDLSPEEEAHLRVKVVEVSDLFKRQIYKTRPKVVEAAFSGDTFIASEALKVGLIDGVKTYSEVFSVVMSAADNYTALGGYDMKLRKVTASMFEAAVASGADPDSMKIVSQAEFDALAPEKKKVTQEAYDAAVESGADPDSMKIVSQAEFDALGLEESGKDEPSARETELEAQVAGLETELAASVASAEALSTEVEELTAKLEASASDPLRVIALDRISNMRIAFGLQAMDLSAFSTAALMVEYTALDKQFKKSFKSGGHLKPKVEKDSEETKAKSAKVTNIVAARRKSVFG